MKKIMIFSVFAMAAVWGGCTKLKKLANISVDIPYSKQVSIPSVPGGVSGTPLPAGGAQLPFPAVPVATNSKHLIQQYNTTAEKVIEVDLKKLSLQIVSPPGQNFNFLDNVEVFISSRTQPEKLLAYSYSIPKGQTTLDLNTSKDVNLKNYFLEDTLYLRLNAHINAVPITGTLLNIDMILHMLANPLE